MIPKRLRSKKGLTIEMGIFMLLIVFALCSLIVTVILFLRVQNQRDIKVFEYKTALDTVGNMFASYENPESFGTDIAKGKDSKEKGVTLPSGSIFTVLQKEASDTADVDCYLTVTDDQTVYGLRVVEKTDSANTYIVLTIQFQSSEIKKLTATYAPNLEIKLLVKEESVNGETKKTYTVSSWKHTLDGQAIQ